jgi:hypothetical protein
MGKNTHIPHPTRKTSINQRFGKFNEMPCFSEQPRNKLALKLLNNVKIYISFPNHH